MQLFSFLPVVTSVSTKNDLYVSNMWRLPVRRSWVEEAVTERGVFLFAPSISTNDLVHVVAVTNGSLHRWFWDKCNVLFSNRQQIKHCGNSINKSHRFVKGRIKEIHNLLACSKVLKSSVSSLCLMLSFTINISNVHWRGTTLVSFDLRNNMQPNTVVLPGGGGSQPSRVALYGGTGSSWSFSHFALYVSMKSSLSKISCCFKSPVNMPTIPGSGFYHMTCALIFVDQVSFMWAKYHCVSCPSGEASGETA